MSKGRVSVLGLVAKPVVVVAVSRFAVSVWPPWVLSLLFFDFLRGPPLDCAGTATLCLDELVCLKGELPKIRLAGVGQDKADIVWEPALEDSMEEDGHQLSAIARKSFDMVMKEALSRRV